MFYKEADRDEPEPNRIAIRYKQAYDITRVSEMRLVDVEGRGYWRKTNTDGSFELIPIGDCAE